MTKGILAGAFALTVAATIAACGGGGGNGTPTSPSPGGGGTGGGTGGGGGTSGATITISNNAVSPQVVTISPGSRVTFVNSDSRAHDMASDPHPLHTDCPELNQVGFLSAGQSRATGNLNTVRTCTFHDHNQDTNTALQGTIRIQ
jgi:plastocyanin